MRVVVAMGSFDGVAGSAAASEAVRYGVRSECPRAEVETFSVANGGEGLLEALADPAHNAAGLELASALAQDAVGMPLIARYLWDGARRAAYVETAETIGRKRLLENGDGGEGLVFRGSSYGLGAQVKTLLSNGVQHVDVGLGGAVTSDGGVGFLLALGARIWDEDGHQIISRTGHNSLLDRPSRIEFAGKAEELADPTSDVSIGGLADVLTPVMGKRGGVKVFRRGSGVSRKEVQELKSAMQRWGSALDEIVPGATATPGAGAGGGLGAVIVALGGGVVDGFDAVAALVGLPEALAGATLVITGQSVAGRARVTGAGLSDLVRLTKRAEAQVTVLLLGPSDFESVSGAAGDLFDRVVRVDSAGAGSVERELERVGAAVARDFC